jgi:hypothetical protein
LLQPRSPLADPRAPSLPKTREWADIAWALLACDCRRPHEIRMTRQVAMPWPMRPRPISPTGEGSCFIEWEYYFQRGENAVYRRNNDEVEASGGSPVCCVLRVSIRAPCAASPPAQPSGRRPSPPPNPASLALRRKVQLSHPPDGFAHKLHIVTLWEQAFAQATAYLQIKTDDVLRPRPAFGLQRQPECCVTRSASGSRPFDPLRRARSEMNTRDLTTRSQRSGHVVVLVAEPIRRRCRPGCPGPDQLDASQVLSPRTFSHNSAGPPMRPPRRPAGHRY